MGRWFDQGHVDRHDRVVVATHPDQALRLLADATDDEREVLGAFRYARNETVLHTDMSVLPRTSWVRASWNYRLTNRSEPLVTYWMNRLQHLDHARPLLVTLNGEGRIRPDSVLAVMAFAGAYHGWGFHEDGAASGATVARAWGVPW